MSSSFGNKIKTTIFGTSHGGSIGFVVDGLPLGIKIDMDALKAFMARRSPGKNELTTKRKERDEVKFVSGVENGVIVASTVCGLIENTDTRSKDYDTFKDVPRPSHADYVAYIKYKNLMDMRGSGQFSGRLTAPLCAVGAIARQILKDRGVEIASHIKNIHGIEDDEVSYTEPDFEPLKKASLEKVQMINEKAREEAKELLEKAIEEKDSVGGIIECFAKGLPVGLGQPNYRAFEGELAKLIFNIPAVRALEFGRGFSSSLMFGSNHNDQYFLEDGRVKTITNNCGGIVGGITNGMPIVFKVAIKPTSSIGKKQRSFSLKENKECDLEIEGRHDPAIVLRVSPVIESALAMVILDLWEEI